LPSSGTQTKQQLFLPCPFNVQHRPLQLTTTNTHPTLSYRYNNYDGPFFDAFTKNYSAGAHVNNMNFGKPGLTNAKIGAMDADPTLDEVWYSNLDAGNAGDAGNVGNGAPTQFLLRLSMPTPAHLERGAPSRLEVLVTVPAALSPTKGTAIDVKLLWFNKTACRLPETLWLTNRPAVNDRTAWTVSKLGQPVNPLDADLSNNSAMAALDEGGAACIYPSFTCGAHLHAVDDGGATYTGSASAGGTGVLQLQSVDNMLLSVGDPLGVPTPLAVPDPLGGVHFALVGNIWNTNYPCEPLYVLCEPLRVFQVSTPSSARSFSTPIQRTCPLSLHARSQSCHPLLVWYPWLKGDEDEAFRFVITV
jgi:hypothetical protein